MIKTCETCRYEDEKLDGPHCCGCDTHDEWTPKQEKNMEESERDFDGRPMQCSTPTVPPTKQYGHPVFYKLLEQMAELHSRKNHDYAGESDPLKNLRSSERLGLEPFTGVMVRLQDKWSRLESFMTQGELLVKNESVEDTLMDNAVYSLLGIILLREAGKK